MSDCIGDWEKEGVITYTGEWVEKKGVSEWVSGLKLDEVKEVTKIQ